MCGIAGIIATGSAPVEAPDLKRLADALAHRGPDGEGLWISPDRRTGLVHRRLAILDTSERGHQPMHSADGRYTIVFNGEIFNFIELRDELIALGHIFVSDSDTEVILAAWQQWGQAMLLRFNGMWALALHDTSTGDLFFARDRFGIKPLLYAQVDDRLAFASEMRALLALPWLPRDVDMQTARRMLIEPFSIEGGDTTLLRHVRRLPAGHLARLSNGRLLVQRWWRTADHLVETPRTASAQADRFRELFFDAIRVRLRSDVPLGTCLSGGFDSSAITCAIAEITRGHRPELREATSWRHAFIGSLPGQPFDETPAALQVAQYAGVEPHLAVIGDEQALAHIQEVLHDLDDVYISLPTAPWHVYRQLRHDKIVVSLDGHGADELMGAYRSGGQNIDFVLRNGMAWLAQRSTTFARLLESFKTTLFTLKGQNFLRGHRWLAPRGAPTPFDNDLLPAHWGALNRRLYRMFHATVLPTILRNFDRLSMAHGIEVRMPFMDWRLVTYVMSLPDEAKSDSERSKLVARDAMAGLMPENIRIDKRKVGFNSPMPGWLNGPLAPWVEVLLTRPNATFEALVDVPALRQRVRELCQAKAWDWTLVGRLWPYLHLKWYLDEVVQAGSGTRASAAAAAATATATTSLSAVAPANGNFGCWNAPVPGSIPSSTAAA